MNREELQRLLNAPDPNGDVFLPSGEFEGPFIINSPCVVYGNNTTLWRGSGAVLTVNAGGTVLNDLRIEITNDNVPRTEYISILSHAHDTKLKDVEVIGRISGIEGEENPWGIPKMLSLGEFPPETHCRYRANIIVPTEAKVISLSTDIKISPEKLLPGTNTITIDIMPIRKGSYIYGEFLICSKAVRRVYVSGFAAEASDFENDKLIFQADADALAAEEKELEKIAFEEEIIYPDIIEPLPEKNEMYVPDITEDEPESPHSLYIINRGMQIPLNLPQAEIELLYDNKDFPMDVDAFAFMLDKHGNVIQNDRFVFFGNDHSQCGSVRYLNAPDKKAVYINFDILPLDIAEIDIAYSIYENPAGFNFSSLKNPAISLKLQGGNQFIYQLEKPLNENTIVGLEIAYRNSRWEFTPLGMIYPRGLSDLCGNYGLRIS